MISLTFHLRNGTVLAFEDVYEYEEQPNGRFYLRTKDGRDIHVADYAWAEVIDPRNGGRA